MKYMLLMSMLTIGLQMVSHAGEREQPPELLRLHADPVDHVPLGGGVIQSQVEAELSAEAREHKRIAGRLRTPVQQPPLGDCGPGIAGGVLLATGYTVGVPKGVCCCFGAIALTMYFASKKNKAQQRQVR